MGYNGYYDYYSYAEPAAEGLAGIAGMLLGFVLVFYLLMLAFCVVSYVFYSLSVYKIAKRRGIRSPWLSWLPVGNLWVIGSISDQYQYVVKGRIRNRRKVLLGLQIAIIAAGAVSVGSGIAMVIGLVDSYSGIGLATMSTGVLLLMYLVMAVASIVAVVFTYIALYDLFESCNPDSAAMFLVLSIFLGVVLPFFLFACRNKDLGMPPRKQEQPVCQPIQAPAEETAAEEAAVQSASKEQDPQAQE